MPPVDYLQTALDFLILVVGLLLGIPFGLWLDRQVKKSEGALRRKDEAARLGRSLLALQAAIKHNRERFKQLATALANSRASFDPALDHSAWEACRPEIVPLLRDADFQRRLAFHFSRVRHFSRLNALHVDLTAGVASAVGGVTKTRNSLREYLAALVSELDAEAASLSEECKNHSNPSDA